MAYCEAVEKEQMLLADVISKAIIKKGNPIGEITERLLCYLFRNEQLDYLKQECMKKNNFLVCFRAFYHIFPYGMFAHFAANSMILNNAIHNYTKTIHIFDFDIGNGVQWSSLFISSSQLQDKELKITSIKWSIAESLFTFEETKKNLDDMARALGLKFTIDELGLCDIKKMKKKNTSDHNKKVVYFFNCMVNLPHMMIARSRKDVMEFTMVAEEFASDGHNVVVTLGDGSAYNDIYRNQGSSSLCSFFEENLTQYRALLESMDHIFPKDLEAAKIAMGCVFVAPFVSSHAWIRDWELGQKELCQRETTVLEGLEVNEEIIFESKVMVKEGEEGMHRVKVEGGNRNEIVLTWRNHPLIRVSCWKS